MIAVQEMVTVWRWVVMVAGLGLGLFADELVMQRTSRGGRGGGRQIARWVGDTLAFAMLLRLRLLLAVRGRPTKASDVEVRTNELGVFPAVPDVMRATVAAAGRYDDMVLQRAATPFIDTRLRGLSTC